MAHEPRIFFDEVNQRQGAFHRRIFLLGGATGLGLLALGGRLAQLQLVDNSRYKLMSADNQYNFRLTPPPRGRILDRNGVLLAGNRPNFRVMMTKSEVADPEATVQRIAEIVPMSDDRRAQIFRDLKQNSKFTPVALAEDLTWDEFSAINIRAPELPGVTADMGEVRLYRYGGAFAHVIGYVAKVSADDVEKEKAARNGQPIDPIILNPGFRIGRQGIEKSHDADLRGKAGAQKVEVDARGRVVRKDPDGDIPPTPGKDIVLTLDADVQNRALDVFGEESGAAVMMDVRNGDILCLLSAPSFDANQFVTGVPSALYRGLSSYDRKPLLDKALFGLYPPGSTFKTLVALAALENGHNPDTVHVCNRAWAWGGRVWHCDASHGAQNLAGAIKTSCDIYFYQTALSLGPDKIAAMAHRFGLGEKYDLGGLDMKRGIVPSTDWKKKYFKKSPANQKWFPGETPSFGIGQGYLQVNAMQLCVMASRIANGQKALQPRLVHSIGGVLQPRGSDVPDLPVDKEHLHFVRQAMAAVVTSGTAAANGAGKLNLGDIQMAGKTGTAQSHSYNGGNGAHGAVGAWNLRDHAWFIAFAPSDQPRYALAVLVEHGGFGATAAVPKAREIMRLALLKDPEMRQRILRSGQAPQDLTPDGHTVARAPQDPATDPIKTARLDGRGRTGEFG